MGVRKAKYRCNGCGKNRPSSKFSNKQFSKKSDVRRCRDCIKAEVNSRLIEEHNARARRYAREEKMKAPFPTTVHCKECGCSTFFAKGAIIPDDAKFCPSCGSRKTWRQVDYPSDAELRGEGDRPSNRIGLVDVIETATASWCPHCSTRMEGGPGGRRKWFCPGCGQLFDANGNAVN